ncbi:MAG: modulator of FtsH protease [Granulosicoccus sp.]|jgi:modulator of FtsH protease
MKNTNAVTLNKTADSILSTNRVLRNTYALLSATLLFSAVMAAVSMAIAPPHTASLVCTIGAIVILMFVLPKYENSASGIGIVFLCTGMLGFGLGPMLNHYVSIPGGSALVGTALGGTGVIFLSLSAYVLTTKKSFNFMGGMLFVGMLVMLGAMVLNLFLNIPAMHMAISGAMVLLMSGFILFDTSRIVSGGETNYIRATVSMFLNIFLLFTHLLQFLGIMSSD